MIFIFNHEFMYTILPFGVNTVQSDGLDCQNIGKSCLFRPCGIDFAGGYIFDVIFVLFAELHKIN